LQEALIQAFAEAQLMSIAREVENIKAPDVED
jgi:hypothetical protein